MTPIPGNLSQSVQFVEWCIDGIPMDVILLMSGTQTTNKGQNDEPICTASY
jgi:hypothetical protein